MFHAFSENYNLYDPEVLDLSGSPYVVGLDFGYQDSTSAILVYTTNSGDYYVADMYQNNLTSTKNHVKAFRELEERNKGTLLDRFGDPSAAQLIHDLREQYEYDISKANNRIDVGLSTINNLMEPQGYNKKPKLFINKNLGELIRQLQSISFKTNVSNNNTSDPFNKDVTMGTHWDAVHALRYAVYSHFRREASGLVIV